MKKVVAVILFVFIAFLLIKEKPYRIVTEKVIKPAPKEFTLISTGDIGLVRDINYKIILEKDPKYPFLKIANYLRDADLTVTNLEGPLIKNCPIIRDGFTFCGKLENVEGLTFAGIDAANLANNHSTNYGLEGLKETEDVLNSNNIAPYGANQSIKYVDVKGYRVALLGFVELGNNWPGLNNATKGNVAKLVNEAKTNSDIVITSFHWGVEYTRKPTDDQVLLAHVAIDSGADLVLGNHPHWIQDNEMYKGKFITYAQGNTIFDQDWSRETREGVIYKFAYKNGKFERIDEKFTVIEDNVQPRFATDQEMKDLSLKLQK